MLIRNAELFDGTQGGRRTDLRVADGLIVEIGTLSEKPGEHVLDARGGALLPGLHDHHIHLMGLAVAQASIRCAPPQVRTPEELAAALKAGTPNASGWLRGIGYHEEVAGDIDAAWLDRHGPDRPIRIQHRSGRMWVFNSRALDALTFEPDHPLATRMERIAGRLTGRIFDADYWLRTLIPGGRPDLAALSARLSAFGVTGVTDMTPQNDDETRAYFEQAQRSGAFTQRLFLCGVEALTSYSDAMLATGPAKIHLHEARLPPFDGLCAFIATSHERGRTIAVHCVTRAELVFTLAALAQVGSLPGDRIEHAAVTPPELMEQIAALKLTVVSQPNFIAERGDSYLNAVEADDRPWLYRARGFLEHGVAFAGGTDAPFGDPDPWRAMHAAVERRALSGAVLAPEECLTPDEAVRLFLGEAQNPEIPRRIAEGATADLCLLKQPWPRARETLSCDLVRATICTGRLVFNRVD